MSTNHKYKYYVPKCEHQYVFITSLILTLRTFFQARCEFHKAAVELFPLNTWGWNEQNCSWKVSFMWNMNYDTLRHIYPLMSAANTTANRDISHVAFTRPVFTLSGRRKHHILLFLCFLDYELFCSPQFFNFLSHSLNTI